jgi:hypothetical protein
MLSFEKVIIDLCITPEKQQQMQVPTKKKREDFAHVSRDSFAIVLKVNRYAVQ